MANHATVFWIQTKGYALCYDADLDNLPTLDIKWLKNRVNASEPFVLQKLQKPLLGYGMYVTYNPETARHKRDFRGHVSRLVNVDKEWLAKVLLQFAATYPDGLSDDMVLNSYYLDRPHRAAPDNIFRWKR